MLESFVDGNETYQFTLCSPMSFVLYECQKTLIAEVAPHQIIPHTHLELKVLTRSGERFTGHGRLHNRKASFLSESEFEKFISLFGKKLKKREKYSDGFAYDGIARLEDIHDFFSHFDSKNLDWRTKDGFKKFLRAYPRIGYKYDETLLLHQNINMLSYVLRSLSRVRSGVADGQHRHQIYSYTLTHNLVIRDEAPMEETQIDGWKGFASQGEFV